MGNNWLNLLIVALAFGAPALSWIVQQLKEKAEQKRMRAELQRRRDEELRTGRSSGDDDLPKLQSKTDDRMTELQRLAERRQQQLRELRARQAQQQTGGMQTAPMPVPTNRRSPSQPQQRGSSSTSQPGRMSLVQIRRRDQDARSRNRDLQSQPIAERGVQGSSIRGDSVDIQQALRESAPEALDQASIAQQLKSARPESPPAKRSVHSRERPEGAALGREVQALLRGARTKDPSKPSLAALYAISEVLGPPVSLRDRNDDGGVVL